MAERKPLDLKAVKDEADKCAAEAKAEKQLFESDFQEAFSFVMPFRIKPGTTSDSRPSEGTDNFSSIGEQVNTDFASEMADTFFPEHTPWAKVAIAATVPDELKEDAQTAAKADTDATFAAINASNFYEAGKQAFKDLGVSATALSIYNPGAGEPFVCQAIPLTELLILRDEKGGIGTRFWERSLTAQKIKALFPDVKLPADVQKALNDKKKSAKFLLRQGSYRDYSVRAEVAWINFTQIHNECVQAVRNVGVGGATIIVARWDPDPNFAWGPGCAVKALPDFRENDELQYLKLKGLARQVDPSIMYDDDQVINMDGGLPTGVAIPRLKGSKVDVIESRHGMNDGLYAVQECEDRIRRHFYQDGPIQKGKTPPTAAQWADESLQKQRRLGTPAAPLWSEFLSEVYLRFRFLLVEAGRLQALIKVGSQTFPIRPVNPLKRAADQQKAIASERVLQSIAANFGPNLVPVIVDIGETAHNLVELYDATGIKLKSKQQINGAIDQNQQSLMLQQAAATAAPLMKGTA